MSDTEQILFSGVGAFPAKAAKFKKPKPGDRPMWFEILEQAFLQLASSEEGKRLYGDPEKGATVEQAWRTHGALAGKFPVCLLSTDRPSVPTDAIERVVKMTGKELVDVLTTLLGMAEKVAVQILYHDGRLGHSITLLGYEGDTARFIYHDPWPDESALSLLSKDLNAAGVDARAQGKYWSITSAELESVIFAAFVGRALWSEYVGEKYYLTYDELRSTDFWTFFHVREVSRKEAGDDGRTLFALKTGGFQSEIDLSVVVNRENRLVEGTLSVKRNWVTGPAYKVNPFAVDIVRSFIGTLVPPPDVDAVTPLVQMLARTTNPAYGTQLVEEGAEKSPWHRAVFTFLGLFPLFEASLPLSHISMKNTTLDGEDWLQVLVTNDAF